MPHFEKVTQLKADYPVATAIGGQYGVNHERKKSLTKQIRSRYQKAGRKEKPVILDEFIKTSGYNRKYALRILTRREPKAAILHPKEGTVKLKASPKRPANRKGKKIYTDELIASLRLIWIFLVAVRSDRRSAAAGPAYEAADVLHRLMAGLWHHNGYQGKAAEDKPRHH
jgi:hypothetical protein